TGSEFVLAWQDERGKIDSGSYDLYLQRLDEQGRLILPNQRFTHNTGDNEAPVIAMGDQGLALAWMSLRGGVRSVWFTAITRDLSRLVPDQLISPPGQSAVGASLVWNRD